MIILLGKTNTATKRLQKLSARHRFTRTCAGSVHCSCFTVLYIHFTCCLFFEERRFANHQALHPQYYFAVLCIPMYFPVTLRTHLYSFAFLCMPIRRGFFALSCIPWYSLYIPCVPSYPFLYLEFLRISLSSSALLRMPSLPI